MAAEAEYQLSSSHVAVVARGVFGSRLAGNQEYGLRLADKGGFGTSLADIQECGLTLMGNQEFGSKLAGKQEPNGNIEFEDIVMEAVV